MDQSIKFLRVGIRGTPVVDTLDEITTFADAVWVRTPRAGRLDRFKGARRNTGLKDL